MVRVWKRTPTIVLSTELWPCVVQAPMYYRGANAAVLLYDITNASSFEDVRGWLEGEPLTALRSDPCPMEQS